MLTQLELVVEVVVVVMMAQVLMLVVLEVMELDENPSRTMGIL